MATLNIDADFDSRASSGAEDETETTVIVGAVATIENRVQLRFPLTGVTDGSTVTDATLQFNVTAESGAGQTIDVYAYNGDGQADPDVDVAADKFSRSLSATLLINDLAASTVGSKTGDLGATADGHIQTNLSGVDRYSIGLSAGAGLTPTTESVTIEAIENAGTDPATLTVVYTPPSTNPPFRLSLLGVGR